jgi:hypothetical protein
MVPAECFLKYEARIVVYYTLTEWILFEKLFSGMSKDFLVVVTTNENFNER